MRALARLQARLAHFCRDTAGSALVEFAVTLMLFLLILFALIDFGRMGFEYVFAQKATQLGARIAVVRPAACPGVPDFNVKGGTIAEYGTSCRSGAGICLDPGTVTCAGSAANATAAEIWTSISPLLPPDATIANLRFTYAFNQDLGFLGGPYTPMVTVRLQNLTFDFVSPLGALAALAGAINPGIPSSVPFPAMSVTLPGEDLAQGESG